MKLGLIFLGSALVVLLAGCAASPPKALPTAPVAFAIVPHEDPGAAGCPLGMPNTRVQVADTPGGVALTFTTPSKVGELRLRVRNAAALHGPGAHGGVGHEGRHDGDQGHGLKLTQMPVGYAAVEDVDGGARLALDAVDPTQLDDLRGRIRARLDEIRLTHVCD